MLSLGFAFRNLPSHLAWVPFVSLFYYGNEAVSILQWEKIDSIGIEFRFESNF